MNHQSQFSKAFRQWCLQWDRIKKNISARAEVSSCLEVFLKKDFLLFFMLCFCFIYIYAPICNLNYCLVGNKADIKESICCLCRGLGRAFKSRQCSSEAGWLPCLVSILLNWELEYFISIQLKLSHLHFVVWSTGLMYYNHWRAKKVKLQFKY